MIEKYGTRQIPVSRVVESERIRKKMQDLDGLLDDICEHGLINPITVMELSDGYFQLIAGQRRLWAVRRLGEHAVRATVLSPMDAQKALELEYAENEQRQQFTVSERLSFAEKLKVIEQAKARERMSTFAREGRQGDQGVDARPHPEKGKSRDVIAKQVGLGSGRQLERAMAVAEQRPDLLEKIDSGETTIFTAYTEAMRTSVSDAPDAPVAQVTTDAGAVEPSLEPEPVSSLPHDKVARAKHERLMKNPLYAELHQKHTDAVKAANTARGELRFHVEGLQKIIRGHEENIRALLRERDALRIENRELRQRLAILEPAQITEQQDYEEGNYHG